jgi:hypothetical protein
MAASFFFVEARRPLNECLTRAALGVGHQLVDIVGDVLFVGALGLRNGVRYE